MKCKECNIEITKETQKIVRNSWGVTKYKSKCKFCLAQDIRNYNKKRSDAIKKAKIF